MVKSKNEAEIAILTAAKSIFSVKGKDGATMQEIANEAGINKALLHYYFRNKDLLFEEVFLDAVKKFHPILKNAIEQEVDLYQKIHQICEAYITMAIDNPFVPVFVLSEVNKQPELFIQKMFGGDLPDFPKLAAQIKREVSLGNIKPIHPQQLILNMMSMCVFPFVFKPIFIIGMQADKELFNQLMLERIKAVPHFIIDSIKI
ncbi:TetR/AcrR family transcriptional regulator [Sediminibacterium sp.]|uniref:TetR/AcrR family transcriptional regulator n=1 Tax=Sediminibacterium sp. TaxID=1917865 RepID=UPI002733964D|nr:TetR/AcrR family transcriptional regulator [Sediminibacterium sp.]MDP3392985.1 TetR/AcrR family transcriptional regulator [Sediminibacterium sp.]MDP3567191.1 TetR/AcrR family transcriptional regulator [Sediminibacterium sp.]